MRGRPVADAADCASSSRARVFSIRPRRRSTFFQPLGHQLGHQLEVLDPLAPLHLETMDELGEQPAQLAQLVGRGPDDVPHLGEDGLVEGRFGLGAGTGSSAVASRSSGSTSILPFGRG